MCASPAQDHPTLPPPPPWHRDLISVGVTGTNGKTSTTTYLAAALARLQSPVARITTVGFFLDEQELRLRPCHESFLETLRRGRELGGRYAAVEVTSVALAHGFARAWPCSFGVFTNLTRDHLDAHKSAEHYLASKAQLFLHLPQGGAAILNGCDASSALLEGLVPAGVRIIRYGLASRGATVGELHVEGRSVDVSWGGTQVGLVSSGMPAGCPPSLRVNAIGAVFAENALAAFAAATAMGVPPERAAEALAEVATPPGRFEVVARRPYVVVDYAHTPDALERTLSTARALGERDVIVVCGAGGHRDKEKRPMIGAAAARADRVILTTDNPRDENPADIVQAIRRGVGAHRRVDEISDREQAIRTAVHEAAPDDVVVIAGRGHELHQEVGGTRLLLSDRDAARRAWECRP